MMEANTVVNAMNVLHWSHKGSQSGAAGPLFSNTVSKSCFFRGSSLNDVVIKDDRSVVAGPPLEYALDLGGGSSDPPACNRPPLGLV
jgi:hypothetical protein